MSTRVGGLALTGVRKLVEGNRWLRALFGAAVVWGCCCQVFAVAALFAGMYAAGTPTAWFVAGLIFWAKAAAIFLYSALRRH